MKLLFFIGSVLFFQAVTAQQVFLRISTPSKTQNAVTSSKQFITGLTCKGCTLTVNGTETKVWPTGAFAVELNLKQGDTSFLLEAANEKEAKESKRVFFNYEMPEKEKAVTTNTVAYWRIEPQADLLLVKPGDKLKMTVKALPGAVVQLENGTSFKEVYVKDSNGVKGIYQMEYVVKDKDDLFTDKPSKLKLMVWAKGTDDPIEATSKSNFAMMP